MTSEKKQESVEDRRETERKRLLALHTKQPSRDDSREPGVLLSDAIRDYVNWFELISPFIEKNLKPACYKLTIGDEYAIGGEIHHLPDLPGSNGIRIPPFAVAIIKTKETINMPPFLIGRWNIQVSRAYQGLLWVGGPQVDAGYVGYLYCPVYNLSDKEVILYYGEPIAVIDFENTTKFHDGKSIPYPSVPENILFEDYKPQNLVSGLVTQAKAKIDQFEPEIKSIGQRVDSFVSLTFAVIAVLFAALTIFVSHPDSLSTWNFALFLISGLAIYLSMSAWLKSNSDGHRFARIVQVIIVVFLLLGLGSEFYRLRNQRAEIEDLKKQMQQLKLTLPISREPVSTPPIEASSASGVASAPRKNP